MEGKWYWEPQHGSYFVFVESDDFPLVEICCTEKEEYARRICQCVNNFDELLKAAQNIREGIRYIKHELPEEMKKPYHQLLQAIRNAEKEE